MYILYSTSLCIYIITHIHIQLRSWCSHSNAVFKWQAISKPALPTRGSPEAHHQAVSERVAIPRFEARWVAEEVIEYAQTTYLTKATTDSEHKAPILDRSFPIAPMNDNPAACLSRHRPHKLPGCDGSYSHQLSSTSWCLEGFGSEVLCVCTHMR